VFQTVQMMNVLFNFFKNTCICTLMMSLFMLLTAIEEFLIRFFLFFSMVPQGSHCRVHKNSFFAVRTGYPRVF
jgi:hypothetical protein